MFYTLLIINQVASSPKRHPNGLLPIAPKHQYTDPGICIALLRHLKCLPARLPRSDPPAWSGCSTRDHHPATPHHLRSAPTSTSRRTNTTPTPPAAGEDAKIHSTHATHTHNVASGTTFHTHRYNLTLIRCSQPHPNTQHSETSRSHTTPTNRYTTQTYTQCSPHKNQTHKKHTLSTKQKDTLTSTNCQSQAASPEHSTTHPHPRPIKAAIHTPPHSSPASTHPAHIKQTPPQPKTHNPTTHMPSTIPPQTRNSNSHTPYPNTSPQLDLTQRQQQSPTNPITPHYHPTTPFQPKTAHSTATPHTIALPNKLKIPPNQRKPHTNKLTRLPLQKPYSTKSKTAAHTHNTPKLTPPPLVTYKNGHQTTTRTDTAEHHLHRTTHISNRKLLLKPPTHKLEFTQSSALQLTPPPHTARSPHYSPPPSSITLLSTTHCQHTQSKTRHPSHLSPSPPLPTSQFLDKP